MRLSSRKILAGAETAKQTQTDFAKCDDCFTAHAIK